MIALRRAIESIGGSPFTPEKARALALAVETKALRLPSKHALDARPAPISPILHALICCSRAVLVEDGGDDVEAWKLVASAALDIGTAAGVGVESQQAQLAAKQRHAAHAAAKELLFLWLNQNAATYSGTLDQMAEDVERQGIIPIVKFSTIRTWIREWRKRPA